MNKPTGLAIIAMFSPSWAAVALTMPTMKLPTADTPVNTRPAPALMAFHPMLSNWSPKPLAPFSPLRKVLMSPAPPLFTASNAGPRRAVVSSAPTVP